MSRRAFSPSFQAKLDQLKSLPLRARDANSESENNRQPQRKRKLRKHKANISHYDTQEFISQKSETTLPTIIENKTQSKSLLKSSTSVRSNLTIHKSQISSHREQEQVIGKTRHFEVHNQKAIQLSTRSFISEINSNLKPKFKSYRQPNSLTTRKIKKTIQEESQHQRTFESNKENGERSRFVAEYNPFNQQRFIKSPTKTLINKMNGGRKLANKVETKNGRSKNQKVFTYIPEDKLSQGENNLDLVCLPTAFLPDETSEAMDIFNPILSPDEDLSPNKKDETIQLKDQSFPLPQQKSDDHPQYEISSQICSSCQCNQTNIEPVVAQLSITISESTVNSPRSRSSYQTAIISERVIMEMERLRLERDSK